MEGAPVAEAGAVVGALGTGLVLLARTRAALLAGLGAFAVAEAALALSLLGGDEARALVGSPARAAAALVALAVVAAGAAAFARFPVIVPLVLLVAAPFRIPLTIGGDDAFLLVPLYAASASTVLALVYRTTRSPDVIAPPLALAVPTALLVGFAGVSLLWSQDVRAGTIDLVFVLFPFAVLVAVLARTPFHERLPDRLGTVFVGLACAFALLGLSQLATRELPFAAELEEANARAGFFRVTALFNDPNIYGRFLAAAIVVVLVALWLARVRLRVGIALIALLAAGLLFAYSQSSFAALFVGVLVTTLLAADAWSRKIILAAAGIAAVVGIALVLVIAQGNTLRQATSGRSDLVANTTEVIRANPLVGVGIGGEREASARRAREAGGRLPKASHTAVLTVAAELGAVGIGLFVAFLAGAVSLFAGARARDAALGLGLGGVFLVIFAHSISYSGFFEDPLTWGTVGVAAAAASQARVAEAGTGRSAEGALARLLPRPRRSTAT